METEPLMYKPDLDQALMQGCQHPDCTEGHFHMGIFLTPRCHPGAGVDVAYYGAGLHLMCHVCDTAIVQIAVADYPDEADFFLD